MENFFAKIWIILPKLIEGTNQTLRFKCVLSNYVSSNYRSFDVRDWYKIPTGPTNLFDVDHFSSYRSSNYMSPTVGILTSVMIAMDYFFRCQKSTVNLENNKRLCQGIFFSLLRNWICLLQNYFWSYVYLKDIHRTLKEIGKI